MKCTEVTALQRLRVSQDVSFSAKAAMASGAVSLSPAWCTLCYTRSLVVWSTLREEA